MYTVDLLKGRCIPTRSSPKLAVLTAGVVAVPAFAAVFFLGCFLNNQLLMAAQRRGISKYQTMIDDLANSERQLSLRKRQADAVEDLLDVATAVAQYTQWSPVLETLVESMPDSLILTGLEVSERPVRKKVPRPDDPKKSVEVSVPARTLRVRLTGGTETGCDRQVRRLTDRLRVSAAMKALLDDVRVSQGFDQFEGRRAVSYQIDCIFKPGL
jgi:Tfp pilus assembly protein PilN